MPAPPAGFNPATASAAQLQAHGLPPRPDPQTHPKGYASRLNAVSLPRITPVLEQTHIYHRPTQPAPAGAPAEVQAKALAERGAANGTMMQPSNSTLTGSYNWSGYSVYDPSDPFKLEAVMPSYVVPAARNPFEQCPSHPVFGTAPAASDVWSSYWVGIDGLANSVLVQNGTEADSYNDCTGSYEYYAAWFEYIPNPESRVINAPVAGGDYVFIETWAASSTVACAFWANESQQWQGALCYSKPSSGSNIQGQSIEWIAERPFTGEHVFGLAYLTNYVTVPFWQAYAYNYTAASPTYYYAGSNRTGTLYQVYGVDDNANLDSWPYLTGIDTISSTITARPIA